MKVKFLMFALVVAFATTVNAQEVIEKEVGVFKESEQGDIDADGGDEGDFGGAWVFFLTEVGDQKSGEVIDGDGSDHQKDVGRFAPAIEGKACEEQDEVTGSQWDKEVHGESKDEVGEEKFERGEEQGMYLLSRG